MIFSNISTKNITKSRLEQIVEIVLWSIIALTFAFVSWVILQGSSLYIKTSSELSQMKLNIKQLSMQNPELGSTNSKKVDLRPLIKENILGDLEAPKASATPSSLNANQVPLILLGTFIGDSSPYAIISNKKSSEEEVFEIGQNIFDTAKLVEVFSDKVKIDRNGTIEFLELDDGNSSESAPSSETSTSGGTVNVSAADLDSALSNLPLLLTQARAVPYFKDGTSVGLRLFAIKPGSLFEKIGLKNGDVLKSINGSSLADITQAVKLFETLKEEKKINLILERNRQDQDINYVIN